MSDDILIVEGGGTSVASDDVSGRHFQRIKLNSSAADSSAVIGDTELTVPGAGNALWVEHPVQSDVRTTAYANSLIVKATPGVLYSINGYNSLASAQFIQVYNTTTLPADTQVPWFIFAVPASSNFDLDLGERGLNMPVGIVIGNSTTGPTKTIGAANCWFNVRFR